RCETRPHECAGVRKIERSALPAERAYKGIKCLLREYASRLVLVAGTVLVTTLVSWAIYGRP
ncbi:MAG: hypothetical protein PHR35_23255, partial [Kiritimatiellae bacterium]|nr:hypothetical protein [Kiritimatiellia bacterium]